MDFNLFLKNISKIKSSKLGGISSQLKMTPLERKQIDFSKIDKNNPKKAAVLALFYPNLNNQTCFLLTKRANYKGTHAAQISFPGGKKDIKDLNFEATALRETFEEVNVDPLTINIIRATTKTYIPPSNFWVYPFMGYLEKTPTFKKNYEVEELITVKLSDLLKPKNLSTVSLETSYMKKITVPCFKLNNHIVWGATAMMLNEIKILFKNLKPK